MNVDDVFLILYHHQLQDGLSKDIRAKFSTIQKSQGTKICKMYQKAEAGLHRQKIKLQRPALEESRKQFFKIIATKEVNEQLNLSLLDLDKESWKSNMLEHVDTERG